jgi:hypothetical protein
VRRLWGSKDRVAVAGLLEGWLWVGTDVLEDEFRVGAGRMGKEVLTDEFMALGAARSSSVLSWGVPASLRADSTDGGRAAPEPMRLAASVWKAAGGSAPGTGEGALEPLAAAALSMCALSWEVWRSVK